MSDLVGNPEDRFSHVEAHFMVTVKKADLCLCFHISIMLAFS